MFKLEIILILLITLVSFMESVPLKLAPVRGCEVFVLADGLGDWHLKYGIIDESLWSRKTILSTYGDTWDVVRAYQGGQSGQFRRWCVNRGVTYGLLTTKCADDGTSSAFLVDSFDRYDLESVASSILQLRPSPFLISGGFSRALFNKNNSAHRTKNIFKQIVNAHNVQSYDPYIEFDSPGSTAYAETCEYPKRKTFGERFSRALTIGISAARSTMNGFFLTVVYTDIDMAAHAGNAGLEREALHRLNDIMTNATKLLEKNCPGKWRLTVVGAHATGGNSTNRHVYHSLPGAPIPLMTNRASNVIFESPLDSIPLFTNADTKQEVVSRHTSVSYHDPHNVRPLTFWDSYVSVLFVVVLVFLVPCICIY